MKRVRASCVTIKDNKILLIHRIKGEEEFFVLPGGGVEEGENVGEAAVRELAEETSLRADVVEDMFSFTDDIGVEQHLILLENIKGKVGLDKNSPEGLRNTKENNFIPEWVPLSKLNSITFYPKITRDFLLERFVSGWSPGHLI